MVAGQWILIRIVLIGSTPEKLDDSPIFQPPLWPIRLFDICKEYYDIALWTILLAHAPERGGALAIYVDTER